MYKKSIHKKIKNKITGINYICQVIFIVLEKRSTTVLQQSQLCDIYYHKTYLDTSS